MSWTVIGIDPSARKLVAVCTRDGEHEVVKHIMPADIGQRCAVAYQWMHDVVEAAPRPVAVFIEAPFSGKYRGSGMVLAKIHGAMLAGAIVAGADIVMPVDNTTWKAKVIGHIYRGENHKVRIRQHVRQCWFKLWKEAKRDQDVMDAGCVNRYGYQLLRTRRLVQRDGVGEVRRLPIRRLRRAA
jgi:Holliday junction resolvasome RuvABC endonuclease subunit